MITTLMEHAGLTPTSSQLLEKLPMSVQGQINSAVHASLLFKFYEDGFKEFTGIDLRKLPADAKAGLCMPMPVSTQGIVAFITGEKNS